ncbi:hypothetical protein [Nocardioides gilvus]|uniref:hypothetical protein n=1 Tax=Nocardioides gilvus TaxID=1735589 RepID=UPI000D7413D9|nr:hypothetical protein [Nocardioides gilvus]
MSETVVTIEPVSSLARLTSIALKVLLLVMLALMLMYPDATNMRDKGAGARAVVYPALAFLIPVVWWTSWRDRVAFPWLADLMVTITCFTDILGNRLNFYDSIVWFDDWMHFMNTGLLAAAFVLLTLPRDTGFPRILERSLALGATGAIVWEIGEFFSFLSQHSERQFAYADTLSDLGLGVFGAFVAAVAVHWLWRAGRLVTVEPLVPATTD